MKTFPAAILARINDGTYRASHLFHLAGGYVYAVVITNGGTGYSSAPTVAASGGGGSDFAAVAVVSGGAVVMVIITNRGKDFTSTPAINFSGGGGSGAAATAYINGTYRWTNALEAIVYGGNTYTPRPYDVGDIVCGQDGDEVTELHFGDIDRVVRGILFTEDFTHRLCTLREVWRSTTDNSVIDAYIVAEGRADGGVVNLEETTEPVRITILPGAEAEGAPGPSQEYTGARCRYQALNLFRGVQCGYAGTVQTCDGTVTTCRALGNEARFGGFQYAPKPGEVIRVGNGQLTLGTR